LVLTFIFLEHIDLFLKNGEHQLLNHVRLDIYFFDSEVLIQYVQFQYQAIEQQILALFLLKVLIKLYFQHIRKHIFLSVHVNIEQLVEIGTHVSKIILDRIIKLFLYVFDLVVIFFDNMVLSNYECLLVDS